MRSRGTLRGEIGLGRRLAPLIARRLMPLQEGEDEAGQPNQPLSIAGTEGMLVTFARCCYPVPDDTVMGYLSAGRGLVIHRDGCGNLVEYRKQPDKWLAVEWADGAPDREYTVEIRADVINRMGVLAAVASNIAGSQSNIEHVQVSERDGDTSSLTFHVQVRNREHVARVLRGIHAMPEVLRVSRVCV